jgi:hypothetical protein
MRYRLPVPNSIRSCAIPVMILSLLVATSPGPGVAGMGQPEAAEVCGPRVYYDVHHDTDGDATQYNDLAALIVGDLGGTFDVQDQFIDTAALDGYNVLLILDSETEFDPAEIAAIANFVTGGGRLVILGEWPGAWNRETVNDVLVATGVYISFNADTVNDPTDNEGITSSPRIHQFANHPLTDGVAGAAIYVGASLNVAPPAVAIASGDDDSYLALAKKTGVQGDDNLDAADPTPEDIYPGAPIVMAYSWAGPGSVFVVGDSDFWKDGNNDGDAFDNLDEFDHRQLARNVFDYPWCRQAGCHRILFDETHGWAFDGLTGDYTIEEGFSELAAFLRGQGHLVESLQDPDPFDAATLSRYDVLALMLPKEYYSAAEKAAIAGFVTAGGRLVTVGEHGSFAGVSLDILNDVHAYLGDGLYHNADEVHDPTDNLAGNDYWPIIHTFSPRPVNAGVGNVVQFLGSSLHLSGSAVGTAFGDNDTYVVLAMQGERDSSGAVAPEGVGPEPDAAVVQPIVVQAIAELGAGDVFAIGDANLWDRVDWPGDGRMSLYRHDNARLAHNVFAEGDWCPRCPVALFKENDPWGLALGRGVESVLPALAVPAADEALLDAAGDLPPHAPIAPRAPFAPEALGDVVNSFAAPDSGFLGLEWIDGFLWVSSDITDLLYRLAPSDGTVLETVPIPTSVTSCGLAWDGSSFWITDCVADEIVQISPTGALIGSFPAPATGPVGLAWDGTHLWDVDHESDEMHRIDPASGMVVYTIPAHDTRPAGLAWDGDYLWTNGRDSVLTYKVDPSTGAVVASFGTPPGVGVNNGRGGAFDGQYLWVANGDVDVIYQIDVEHVPTYADPNEQILQAWSIPYDVWGAADVGAIDLSPYCKVIVPSTQNYAFYQTVSTFRGWFSAWIAEGGTFDLHGACFSSEDWSGLPMPGNFTSAWDPWDDVTILAPDHALLQEPNPIVEAGLDGWGSSTHGFLANLPPLAESLVAHASSGEPVLAEFRLGLGCVVATEQPLEWGWWHHDARLLENEVLYRCRPLSRVYLPLVLRDSP